MFQLFDGNHSHTIATLVLFFNESHDCSQYCETAASFERNRQLSHQKPHMKHGSYQPHVTATLHTKRPSQQTASSHETPFTPNTRYVKRVRHQTRLKCVLTQTRFAGNAFYTRQGVPRTHFPQNNLFIAHPLDHVLFHQAYSRRHTVFIRHLSPQSDLTRNTFIQILVQQPVDNFRPQTTRRLNVFTPHTVQTQNV